MATASHAAGLKLRQTVWAMQGLALATGLEGFERFYRPVCINYRPDACGDAETLVINNRGTE